jgi:hypothetical protein
MGSLNKEIYLFQKFNDIQTNQMADTIGTHYDSQYDIPAFLLEKIQRF